MKVEHMLYENKIINAVKNERDIVFIIYSLIDETERKIRFTLAKILENNRRLDLYTPLISCTRELISNAMKANVKKIVLKENGITDSENSTEIIKKIKSILNKKLFPKYCIKAKEYGLSTRLYFKISKNSLLIEVINNLPLTDNELKRINDKIKKSSGYNNIAAFFIENPDPEAEGMGLGISMIVVILKNILSTHKNFTITTNGLDKTYARLFIPLR